MNQFSFQLNNVGEMSHLGEEASETDVFLNSAEKMSTSKIETLLDRQRDCKVS